MDKTMAELEHDSDRAAGIVGAVLVEDSLTTLLQSRLWRDEDLVHELFRASGPLGAFSVKINMGFLMGLYSPAARKEMDTIKEIRNEFAHRVARSFSFERIRDLANNLSMSEKIEFYIATQANVLYIGTKGPAEHHDQLLPVIPPLAPEELIPRQRYLRACQFYTGALLFTAHAMPAHNPAVFF